MFRITAMMVHGACVFTDMFVYMNKNYTFIMSVVF